MGEGVGPTRRGKVLVVDDERVLANSIARMLGEKHDVTVETDPRRALARISEGQLFDIILCDLMMPGMSGIELYNEIALFSLNQAKRMVFMTGGTTTENAQEFLDALGNLSLTKPFTIEAVHVLVSEYLK